jgi:hypothetical protein
VFCCFTASSSQENEQNIEDHTDHSYFFRRFYSFRLYFIRNNIVLKAYNFLQGPDVREII